MIISQVAARTPLSHHVLHNFIEGIAKHARETSFTDSLLCIVFLCQTQDLGVFPIEALKYLASFRYSDCFSTHYVSEFIPSILEFQSRHYDTRMFLHHILMLLVTR